MPNLDLLLTSTEFQGLPSPEVVSVQVTIPAQTIAADTGSQYNSEETASYQIENYHGMFYGSDDPNTWQSGSYLKYIEVMSGLTLTNVIRVIVLIESDAGKVYLSASLYNDDVSGLNASYNFPGLTISCRCHIYDRVY